MAACHFVITFAQRKGLPSTFRYWQLLFSKHTLLRVCRTSAKKKPGGDLRFVISQLNFADWTDQVNTPKEYLGKTYV